MKGNAILGLITGLAAGVAATVAVNKVVKEIKTDAAICRFTSPDANNFVTLSYGSSDTAKGLTCIRVIASSENAEDDCKLVILTKKADEMFKGEWTDNDHFTLLVGKGKRKWRCDVDFDGKEICAELFLEKEEKEAAVVADVIEEAEAEDEVEETEEN